MIQSPATVVVSGPSGCGKSTIGTKLATLLGAPFVEGDDFHSAANVAKMRSGTPLNDEDRAPWLERLHTEVILRRGGAVPPAAPVAVLACSALKRAYRNILRAPSADGEATPTVFFIFLDGDRDILRRRLEQRAGHYMPPRLLQSQLDTLEPLQPGEYGASVDVGQSAEAVVRESAQLVLKHIQAIAAAKLRSAL